MGDYKSNKQKFKYFIIQVVLSTFLFFRIFDTPNWFLILGLFASLVLSYEQYKEIIKILKKDK